MRIPPFLSRSILLLIFAAAAPARGALPPAPVGKTPLWQDENDALEGRSPESASQGAPTLEGVAPLDNTPTEDVRAPAPPLVTMSAAVAFIQSQRGLGGRGLPATFRVPAGTTIADPLRRLIIFEGVGLYDTALAVITLLDAGEFDTARQIADLYVAGVYSADSSSPMELRAYPTRDNAGAFEPFDDQAYYFFDFTNVRGNWLRLGDGWKFWTVHTGPNAWFANALCRLVLEGRRRGFSEGALAPYENLARCLGHAMERLQDKNAFGGVRYGPARAYHEAGTSDPFEEINSENNVSAFVAFQLLYRTTGRQEYAKAAERILTWFFSAPVWTADGKPRQGLYDSTTQMLAMGAEFRNGRWTLQDDHPTDAGGTWTISSLGPARIDGLWGRGAAYAMWKAVRSRAGRTSDFRYAGIREPVAGLDYNDAFPPNESLISPEWTAGGLFALRTLLAYYENGSGRGVLSATEVEGLRRDLASMSAFVRQHANPYALGPGQGGTRQGQTGFHWYCPPSNVDAMASLYVALFLDGKDDPNAFWRSLPDPALSASRLAAAP